MKYLVVLLAMVFTACGSGGGSPSSSPTPGSVVTPPGTGVTPTCKSVYSAWQSTSDSESHDFSAFSGVTSVTDYSFTNSIGGECGHHDIAASTMTAPQWASNFFVIHLQFAVSIDNVSACAIYKDNLTTTSDYLKTFATMTVTVSCNSIEICDGRTPETCKEFN